MTTLRVTIRGFLGQISAESFTAILQRTLRVLHELDRRMSEERRGTLRWVVTGLGEGSAYIELSTKVIHGNRDYSSQVLQRFTSGLAQIQREGITPPYFSHNDMEALRDIVRQFRKDGVASVGYIRPNSNPVELTEEAGTELEKLVGVRYRAFGSIEGRVELVSVKRGARRFNITHHRTLRSIRCTLPENIEGSVLDAIKGRYRVVASGMVSYNAKNEPIGLNVTEPLRFLGRQEDLPTTADLGGADPEITGSMTTEVFIRSLRDG